MRFRCALARGCALADDGTAQDETRLTRICFRFGDRAIDRVDIMSIDRPDHLPAVRSETRRAVVGEPALHPAVDRDAIVVVQRDELAQLPGAGECAGLVRDAFHQAAITEEDIGVMIDDDLAGLVELGAQQLLREGEADGIGETLAERTGRRLHARRHVDLWMTWRFRMQLAEILQLIHRQVVAAQVQQRVLQHRAVPIGEHETIAIGPVRIGRVMAQMTRPQRDRDLGHAHRHARMAGFCLFHCVGGEKANRVGQARGVDAGWGAAHANRSR